MESSIYSPVACHYHMKARNLSLTLTSSLRAVTIYGLRRVAIPINANICARTDLQTPDCCNVGVYLENLSSNSCN